jgi:hypothetical protein
MSVKDVLHASPAAVVIALYVGIVNDQLWAILPVAAASGVVVLIGYVAARLGGFAPAMHGHGITKKQTIWHERDGHAKMFAHYGIATTWKVWRNRDGEWEGITKPVDRNWQEKLTPTDMVALYAAGGIAAGTRLGCGSDEEGIQWAKSQAGLFGGGRAEREGRALAEKVVG